MHKIIAIVLMACLFTVPAHAACTLSVPQFNNSYDALQPPAPGVVTTTATVNCPSGQAWSLFTVAPQAYLQAFNGAKYMAHWVCDSTHTATCNTYKASNTVPIASGTGTGAPQTVTMYVTPVFSQTDYVYVSAIATQLEKVQVYIGALTLKLVGDTSPTTDLTAVDTFIQTCKITSTTNWTAAYTGAADVTGTFNVSYACGYGTTPDVSVSIGSGSNAVGGVRRAAKSGQYIGYHLFWDAAFSNEIGASTNNSVAIPVATGASGQSYGTKTIYGKILKTDLGLTTASVNGAYVDVVGINVNF